MLKTILTCALIAVCTASSDVVYRDPQQSEEARMVNIEGNGVTVEFNLGTLTGELGFIDGYGTGTFFRVQGGGLAADAGYPDLPAVRRMVRVENTGSVDIEILEMETISIGYYHILPFQPLQSRGMPVPPVRVNPEVYEGNAQWPEDPVRIESVDILRDIRIAWVSYVPVSWNPRTGEVTLTTSVTARISTGGGTGLNELLRCVSDLTRSFLPFYRDVLGFMDYSRVVDGSYVFISSAEGIELVSDLINWKERKGFHVEVGIVPDIGSTAEEIDAWIESAFNTWPIPPEYVLIVGDDYVVPSPEYSGHAADNIYGVIGDGCVPSIHVGRLSGSDTDDLVYEAWKITEHEMHPHQPSESWFNKGMSIGHTEFTENSWEYIEYMMAAGMTTTWFCSNGGLTPTIESLSDSINSGYSIIGFCGHGDLTHIYPPGFSNSDVAELSNGRKLPWIALVACQTGMFDGYYCISEAFMGEGEIGEAKGAIGVMSPTTNSPYGAADSLVKWIFKGYFQENIHHLGAVTDWSKKEVFAYYGNSGVNNNHMHMIFGCPEMDIYSDTSPLPVLDCDHPDPLYPGVHSFTVTAEGMPEYNVLVAVLITDSSGTWMDSDYTDPSGMVMFDIPPFGDDPEVYVTATGYNRYPYLYGETTSIEESDESFIGGGVLSMTAGPSPCYGLFSINCAVGSCEDTDLWIYDVSGRLVLKLDLEDAGQGEASTVWNGCDRSGNRVSSGVYFCVLRSNQGQLVQSFVLLE